MFLPYTQTDRWDKIAAFFAEEPSVNPAMLDLVRAVAASEEAQGVSVGTSLNSLFVTSAAHYYGRVNVPLAFVDCDWLKQEEDGQFRFRYFTIGGVFHTEKRCAFPEAVRSLVWICGHLTTLRDNRDAAPQENAPLAAKEDDDAP